MTTANAPPPDPVGDVTLGPSPQPERLSLWLGLYAAALLVPFAFEVGRAGGPTGVLSGPWLLLRALAAVLVYRFAARPGSAAALAAGLGAGHLVAVSTIDPMLGGGPFGWSLLGRLLAVSPALFAFLAAKEHLSLMANRNAVVASPAFLVRAGVSAFTVLCFASGPLVVSFLLLTVIRLGGPLPALRP